ELTEKKNGLCLSRNTLAVSAERRACNATTSARAREGLVDCRNHRGSACGCIIRGSRASGPSLVLVGHRNSRDGDGGQRRSNGSRAPARAIETWARRARPEHAMVRDPIHPPAPCRCWAGRGTVRLDRAATVVSTRTGTGRLRARAGPGDLGGSSQPLLLLSR